MKKPKTTTPSDTDPERIAKVIARAGLCSRREAETWIGEGRVSLNGRVLDTPAVTVRPGDTVLVDGKPLPERDRTRLWLFHKPRGLVTTNRDPEGRQTVFEILPAEMPRVMSVGRLDINTEGLLLLTNDGGLARVLELPATGWLRRYRVRAHGEIDQYKLDALQDGIAIDGILYGAIEATLDRKQGDNVWITMGLREGKNREVKNILAHLGLDVNRLIRLSFGPFQLGELAVGAVEEVPRRILKDQLGERLAGEAGADFSLREGERQPIQQTLSGARSPRGRSATERTAGIAEPARSRASEPEARGRSAARPRRASAGESRRRHEADIDHNAEAGRGRKPVRPAAEPPASRPASPPPPARERLAARPGTTAEGRERKPVRGGSEAKGADAPRARSGRSFDVARKPRFDVPDDAPAEKHVQSERDARRAKAVRSGKTARPPRAEAGEAPPRGGSDRRTRKDAAAPEVRKPGPAAGRRRRPAAASAGEDAPTASKGLNRLRDLVGGPLPRSAGRVTGGDRPAAGTRGKSARSDAAAAGKTPSGKVSSTTRAPSSKGKAGSDRTSTDKAPAGRPAGRDPGGRGPKGGKPGGRGADRRR